MTQPMLDLFAGLVPAPTEPEPADSQTKRSKPGRGSPGTGTQNNDTHPERVSPEPKPKQPKATTDADLRAGAMRLFVTVSDRDPGPHGRVTVKVRLPADVLAVARSKRSEAVPPTDAGGRPSVAAVLSKLLDRVLNSAPTDDLVSAVDADPGPRAGIVNVTVDSDGYALVSACARRLGTTSPELIARVLTLGLRGRPLTRMPSRRVSPSVLEVAHDLGRADDSIIAVQAWMPFPDLRQAQDLARSEKADRPRMIGRLLTDGLSSVDRDPLPFITVLTDPQMVVPPATSRARIRVERGTWLTILGLAQLLERRTDEVAAALLSAGMEPCQGAQS